MKIVKKIMVGLVTMVFLMNSLPVKAATIQNSQKEEYNKIASINKLIKDFKTQEAIPLDIKIGVASAKCGFTTLSNF